MIRINLLPADLETPQTLIHPGIPVTAAALLPLLVIIPLHLSKINTDNELQAEIKKKNDRLRELQPVIDQIASLETARTNLNNRKNVIKQLEEERLRYPKFMDDFVKLLPSNLWLTNLTTVVKPAANMLGVNMDVIALDNYAIADLLSNLESSQAFTEIELGPITASAGTATQGPTMTFRVTATYKRIDTIPNANKKS